jgi:hypothetical protein
MMKKLAWALGAVLAAVALVTPVLAWGVPGCGIGGYGGCGFGAPFGIGPCGSGSPLVDIVGLGIAMIESVIGAAFSCISGLVFGGCGIPFGGYC